MSNKDVKNAAPLNPVRSWNCLLYPWAKAYFTSSTSSGSSDFIEARVSDIFWNSSEVILPARRSLTSLLRMLELSPC